MFIMSLPPEWIPTVPDSVFRSTRPNAGCRLSANVQPPRRHCEPWRRDSDGV